MVLAPDAFDNYLFINDFEGVSRCFHLLILVHVPFSNWYYSVHISIIYVHIYICTYYVIYTCDKSRGPIHWRKRKTSNKNIGSLTAISMPGVFGDFSIMRMLIALHLLCLKSARKWCYYRMEGSEKKKKDMAMKNNTQ